MVKKLFTKVSYWPVALFLVEWCCFIAGVILSPMYLKLMLLTAARVLP